jgi:hypothetical protein
MHTLSLHTVFILLVVWVGPLSLERDRDNTLIPSIYCIRAKEEAAMLNSLACASRVQLAHRLRFNTLLQVIQQRAVSTDHFQTLGIEASVMHNLHKLRSVLCIIH